MDSIGKKAEHCQEIPKDRKAGSKKLRVRAASKRNYK